MNRHLCVATVATASAAVLALSACSSGQEADPAKSTTLTIWTLEDTPDRIKILEGIASDFGSANGVTTKVVAVDAAQFNQLMVSAAAAAKLPDLVASIGLDGVGALAANDLLDTDTPQKIVDKLGADTFDQGALELATVDGKLQAVPSDSYPTVLLYRKDLFAKYNVPEPKDYDSIMAAAAALHGKDGMTGFAGFTTEQGDFEGLALANGCELVDESGAVTIDSPQCVQTFAFYNDLITKYSFKGDQDWDAVRASYMSGKAAMAMYSSYILDELAGLKDDMMPSCAQCKSDPAYLAKNTGIVAEIGGADGKTRGQFRMQTDWAITSTASPAAADFVEYVMSDAYERWIGMVPEGKVPNRLGTADEPTKYIDAWKKMGVGTAKQTPLVDIYGEATVQKLIGSDSDDLWWAVRQGQANLLGAMLASLPVEDAMNDMFDGTLTPEQAAKQAAEKVTEIQDSLT